MKTIAAKYVAPLVLAVGITGGFVGFELSQAFYLESSATETVGTIGKKGVQYPQGDKKDDSTKRPMPGFPKPII